MTDYIKRAALKFAAPLIEGADVRVDAHKSLGYASVSTPGALGKIEQASPESQILPTTNVRVQIRAPPAAWLGQSFLRIKLTAPGSLTGATGPYQPYCGYNVIRSLRVLYGSETLVEISNYRAALKAWLRYMSPAQAEAIQQAMGGSTVPLDTDGGSTICVPLIAPWGMTDGVSPDQQFFLPVHKLTGNINFEITYNSSDKILPTAPTTLNCAASVTLVSYEASFVDGEALDGAPLVHRFRDFTSFAPTYNAAAVTDQTTNLASLVGSIEALHLFHTSAASFDGANQGDYGSGTAVFSGTRIDGREYLRQTTPSRAETALDLAIHGFGRVEFDGGQGSQRAAVLPIALFPKLDAYTGGMPTSDVRAWDALVSSSAAATYEIAAVGTAMLVIDRGVLLRKRM